MYTQHTHAAVNRTTAIQQIFQDPAFFVRKLQQQTLLGWLTPLAFAVAGYALYGVSAAAFRGGSSFLYAAGIFPLMFLLALSIGIPALYIFDAFFGSDLQPKQFLALGLVAFVVPAAVLAGCAPINWFFAVSVKSPAIITVTNHAAIILAALLGYHELLQLHGELDPLPSNEAKRRRTLLSVWLALHLGILYKLMLLLMPLTGIFQLSSTLAQR